MALVLLGLLLTSGGPGFATHLHCAVPMRRCLLCPALPLIVTWAVLASLLNALANYLACPTPPPSQRCAQLSKRR